MTPYKNINRESGVISYEIGANSIQVVFRTGAYRHYLYDYASTGQAKVERMKALATQGYGLNSYITTVVRDNYARKW